MEEERLSVDHTGAQTKEEDNEHYRALERKSDLKKLQAELKAMQMQKQERQVEVEPLQEQAAQMITQLEEEKKSMAQAHIESATLIHEDITAQSVEALTGKVMQVKMRGRELAEKFQILETTIEGACTN
jgi:hypothetical protein